MRSLRGGSRCLQRSPFSSHRPTPFTHYTEPAAWGLWPRLLKGAYARHVGAWYCIEAHVRMNDSGLSNGLFEYWIDGALETSRSDLNWVGAYDEYGINAIFFENYWNSGSPVAQERYFDNIVVSTSRIGC